MYCILALSSNHLHLFCGVRCSQSVSQNIPVYWCSFFQMFDKKKRGPEKNSQIDSWQQRKMQGAICLPELTEQTSMSLFFKSFGKYILSLNKVCFEVTVVISRFPPEVWITEHPSHAAFQLGIARSTSSFPLGGDPGLNFSWGTRPAGQQRTAGHKYLKLWSKGFVGNVWSHSHP